MQSFCLRHAAVLRRGRPAALAGLHAERVLLVTDPYFAENGTAARYAAAFPGAQVEIFSDVAPDPRSLVAQGVARLQALRPDTVLALGGGSAIDCAKGHRRARRPARPPCSRADDVRQRLRRSRRSPS